MTEPLAFGMPDGVIDIGGGRFVRPQYELQRRGQPEGTPIHPDATSALISLVWWHDCPARAEGGWLEVTDVALVCPFCGDQSRLPDLVASTDAAAL